MANFTMRNWRIADVMPYPMLGSAGENNASTIIITVDSLIENAEYYLDIVDMSGNGLPNTQQLTARTDITSNDETVNTLSLSPLTSFLGREGVKNLQVRCVYEQNNQLIVKESNVFHAQVDKNSGFIYKYSIAVFEQYIKQIKDLINDINTNHNGQSGSGDSGNSGSNTNVETINIDMKDVSDVDGTVTIDSNKYYNIMDSRHTNNSVVKLTIALGNVTSGEFHFSFISGNTTTELVLPNSVLIPSSLSITTNTYYDVHINPYTHVMTYTSQGFN